MCGRSKDWYELLQSFFYYIKNLYYLNCWILVLQEAETGVRPTFFEVYLKARKGTDPDRPEQLIDEGAMEKMVSIFSVGYIFHEVILHLFVTSMYGRQNMLSISKGAMAMMWIF
jgi:hypothetical protein